MLIDLFLVTQLQQIYSAFNSDVTWDDVTYYMVYTGVHGIHATSADTTRRQG